MKIEINLLSRIKLCEDAIIDPKIISVILKLFKIDKRYSDKKYEVMAILPSKTNSLEILVYDRKTNEILIDKYIVRSE